MARALRRSAAQRSRVRTCAGRGERASDRMSDRARKHGMAMMRFAHDNFSIRFAISIATSAASSPLLP